MHMVTTGLAHADQCRAGGDDRYMVHLVRYADSAALLTVDGRALHPSLAGTVECDAARVTHAIGNKGEPLHLGRKTRDWSSAQRRAVSIRDGGHCRFVGCHHAHVDIHHLRPWEDGGQTDIDNAVSQCPRHHHMLHAGYRTAGDPHGELRFFRPDGSYLGSTFPAHARRLAGV
jgi:hypothetical protein